LEKQHKLATTAQRISRTLAEMAKSFAASMLAGVALTGQALNE
jgi:hypothetical protein